MKRLKSIFAFFWISVLLFALSGKTVHIFLEHGHDHEFVCTEKSTHIHEKEHSCFICEFDLQLSDGFIYNQLPVNTNIYVVTKIGFATQAFISSQSKFNFNLRGPPAA